MSFCPFCFPSRLKPVLRPLYHFGFRIQLRLRCLLNDFVHRKYNRAYRIPPAMVRFRVGESIDSATFLNIGRGCARLMEEHLHEMGSPPAPGVKILDFGCGCGRVASWLMTQAPRADFYGVDVDKEAIHWCIENLKGAHFEATAPNPPLPFAAAFFDAVYCVSVFTHLDEDMQDAWLAELKRILKSGGILIFTVHGSVAAEELNGNERDKLGVDGFLYHRSAKLKGILPSWYHTAWHTEAYVVERASRWFSRVEYCVIPNSGQDVVRCRR
jgi:ubiquinone/menaquinone biosynthesis C-methylase UbiE